MIEGALHVREAGIDDLAGIFHLGERLFTSASYSNLYRTWDEHEVTTLFNQDSELLLIAEDDKRLLGFAMGTIIEKARSPWNYGHLLWLGVVEDAAGLGLGGKLFDHFSAIMEQRGVRMLMVDTQADNKAAIAFFRKKGFENPVDHLYMTKNIS